MNHQLLQTNNFVLVHTQLFNKQNLLWYIIILCQQASINLKDPVEELLFHETLIQMNQTVLQHQKINQILNNNIS